MINLKRLIFKFIVKLSFLLRFILPIKRKILIVYDLAINGIGYDFFIFMENALQYKKNKRIKNFDLVILSADTENNGLIFKKQQYLKEKKNFNENGDVRLSNIVLNTLNFYPEINNIYINKKRISFFKYLFFYDCIFPQNFNIYRDYKNQIKQISWASLEKNKNIKELQGIKVLNIYLDKAKNLKKIYKKKLVTISLRESSYSKYRNSNKNGWLKVCKYLEKIKIQPIVIRDFEFNPKRNNPFKKYELAPEATFNLNYRAAIYKVSEHNFFPDGGYFPLSVLQKNANLSRWKYDKNLNKKSYLSHLEGCVADKRFPNNYRLGGKNYHILLKDDNFKNIKKFIDQNLA